MDDARVWDFEKSLWLADAAHYRASIDPDCLMVIPAEPYALQGEDAVAAVSDTPRWSDVRFEETHITRPQEGLIVIAYRAHAMGGGSGDYVAWCTSTYRRLAEGEWRVLQHQQTPPLIAPAG